MSPDRTKYSGLTAFDIRSRLVELEAERYLALDTGLAETEMCMADLDEEIAEWRPVYELAAVTDIATLRAELFGAEQG